MFRRLLLIALAVSIAAAAGCTGKEAEKSTPNVKNRLMKPDGAKP
jgi:hypothetical protein